MSVPSTPISISSSESQAFPAAAAILPVIDYYWLIPALLSLFCSFLRHFCFGINSIHTVAINSHAQFCIQDSKQCNKLECSPGVQKEGQFPAPHHQRKKTPPKSSDLSFLQTKIFFPACTSIWDLQILFQTKKLSFNSFFFGCWNFGSVGRWRRFCSSN